MTDRVHFLEDQRRHRRASRASAALVVAGLVVSGIPLCVLISPVVLAGVLLLTHLVDLVATVPPEFTGWLDRATHVLPTAWSAIRREDVAMPWGLIAGLFILPGALLMFLLWAAIRVSFRRTGVGGVLRRMEARPPRPGDLAEQRLVNLVEEIAIAAAVPPPRVLLIDTPAVNAAAVGLTIEDVALVVTRGFVDRLPRDQQQAFLAHVIGSVGNGDLIVAGQILTVLQAWGLVSMTFEAPILPGARKGLALVGKTTLGILRGTADASQRERALDRMLAGAGHEDVDLARDLEVSLPSWNPLVLLLWYLPLLVIVGPAAIAAKAVIWLFTLLIAGPWVAFLWRARRRLADATAVELTRHPEALASALRTMASVDVTVPEVVAVHFLFPVWDPAVDRDETRTDVASVLLRMQLPLEARLARLQKLSAFAGDAPAASGAGPSARPTARELGELVQWLGLAVLLVAALLAVNALVAAGVLLVTWWVLHAVFVAVPAWLVRLVGKVF